MRCRRKIPIEQTLYNKIIDKLDVQVEEMRGVSKELNEKKSPEVKVLEESLRGKVIDVDAKVSTFNQVHFDDQFERMYYADKSSSLLREYLNDKTKICPNLDTELALEYVHKKEQKEFNQELETASNVKEAAGVKSKYLSKVWIRNPHKDAIDFKIFKFQ